MGACLLRPARRKLALLGKHSFSYCQHWSKDYGRRQHWFDWCDNLSSEFRSSEFATRGHGGRGRILLHANGRVGFAHEQVAHASARGAAGAFSQRDVPAFLSRLHAGVVDGRAAHERSASKKIFLDRRCNLLELSLSLNRAARCAGSLGLALADCYGDERARQFLCGVVELSIRSKFLVRLYLAAAARSLATE